MIAGNNCSNCAQRMDVMKFEWIWNTLTVVLFSIGGNQNRFVLDTNQHEDSVRRKYVFAINIRKFPKFFQCWQRTQVRFPSQSNGMNDENFFKIWHTQKNIYEYLILTYFEEMVFGDLRRKMCLKALRFAETMACSKVTLFDRERERERE